MPDPFFEDDDAFILGGSVDYNVDLAKRLIESGEISAFEIDLDVPAAAAMTRVHKLDWDDPDYQSSSFWRPSVSPERAMKIPHDSMDSPLLIVPRPGKVLGLPRDIKFVVIDGNHRLARKAKEGCLSAKASFISDPKDVARFAYRICEDVSFDMYFRRISNPWEKACEFSRP